MHSVTRIAADLAAFLMDGGATQAEAVKQALAQVPRADAGNVRKYLRKRRKMVNVRELVRSPAAWVPAVPRQRLVPLLQEVRDVTE